MDTAKVEKLWKRFQQHMGYTDEEMKIFRSDPVKVKMVTESSDFVKTRIVAEVIEATGCHAQHKVGDKIVMNGNGQLLTAQCPEKLCAFAVAALEPSINRIYERFIAHSDPEFKMEEVVQCHDIGLDKGGWGKIYMKVRVEKI
ncbi:MAG: hypothetical protein HY730_03995 [Candidatus Tectomicrobia bacterium]|uniref:TIGR04076 family protein n=1 Tax=Tectimicrobiota bacterium TaxID=2528274 RepID=A0A933GMM2_UNCTE|nr:hypothetical protein [Candidatus Tectomicrobia bacterium]